MTIEAFRAFVDDRPDPEKWELIDGELIFSPAPTNRHQRIVGNVLYELEAIRRRTGAAWQAIPGIGTRHPKDRHWELAPDVMILPEPTHVVDWTFDALAAFEVLSPGSVRRDIIHKPEFYRRVASLTHYVVLAQGRQEAIVFAREAAFSPRRLIEDDAQIAFDPLGVSLRLADCYRDVILS